MLLKESEILTFEIRLTQYCHPFINTLTKIWDVIGSFYLNFPNQEVKAGNSQVLSIHLGHHAIGNGVYKGMVWSIGELHVCLEFLFL